MTRMNGACPGSGTRSEKGRGKWQEMRLGARREVGGGQGQVMQGLADFVKTLGFNLNTMECLWRVSERGLACSDYIL